MGIGITVFLILQFLLINDNQTPTQLIKSIVAAVGAGAVAGFFFALSFELFHKSKFVEGTTKIDTDPDENILFETPAIHF